MQEPPRVTITDPSRPGPGPVDELDEEGPRSRRGLYLLVGALVLLLGGRGVATVLDRREAAAEERRLASVVELELTQRSGTGRENRSLEDLGVVERGLSVRNTGPRPVEVLTASYGPLAFDGELLVRPGSESTVLLAYEFSCAQRPAQTPLPDGTELQLTVRTSGGPVVDRRLPLPDGVVVTDADLERRICGYLEPYEAGSAFPTSEVRLQDGALVTELFVGNGGRDPLALALFAGGSGMRAELLDASGRPVDLPLEIASGVGSGLLPPLTLTLRLTVAECAAVVRPDPSGDVFSQESAAAVRTGYAPPGEQPSAEFEGFTILEPQQTVLDLIEQSCP